MNYDIIIIWTWSAGLSAWIYASRYRLKNLIIWELLWWTPTQAHIIENYPWFDSIKGTDLANKFLEQAKLYGSEVIQDSVVKVIKTGAEFVVKTGSSKEFKSKYILIATWNKYKKLEVKWEQEFLWKWVSYCWWSVL